jgi:tetratricopeptide (TPR) repeat protein
LKLAHLQTNRPANKPHSRQALFVCAFLLLAVLAVFGQTAHFDFVNYDDDMCVSENPVVERGLSVNSVAWAFTHSQINNWIPLTTLSHMLDCQIFGPHAGGHHLVNVLLHGANTVLLFLVLRQMTGSLWRSGFVAALFAVHPLRAESVAWVSERKDVLSGFFFMLALGAYAGYVEKFKIQNSKFKIYYALTLVFFALGLLAKSMVASLPFVLLLLDYWPLGRMMTIHNSQITIHISDGPEKTTPSLPFWGLVKEKIPLFLLSAGSCVATALVPGLVITDARQLSLLDRIANALVSYVVYLRQIVFPANLAAIYPYAPGGEPGWKAGAAFALLAAVSAGAFAWRKKHPCLLMGWLWFLGMLLPVSGIVQLSPEAAHADRYTYLPAIGLTIAGTWLAWDLSHEWWRRRELLGGLMLAVIAALAYWGHIQTSYWKESQTLWTHALDCTSGNSTAHYNLGVAFADKGEYDKALAQYLEALEINPRQGHPHNNLGNILKRRGDLAGAIAQYRAAAEIEPELVDIRLNLGDALAAAGQLNEAIEQYNKALQINPANEAAHFNLGFVLFQKGDAEGAIAQYREVLRIKPDNAAACFSLALALAKTGRVEEALLSYRQAIKINPQYTDAYWNLGLALIRKGETRQAIDCFQQDLAAKPDQPIVQNFLAWLLATAPEASLRDGALALELAQRAMKLTGGGNAMILRTIAAAYAERGLFADAASTARHALELAIAQNNDDLKAKLQSEIQLYEAEKPMRDVLMGLAPQTKELKQE